MTVDAGGFAKGYGPTAELQTEYVVKCFQKIGYDAINLSHKEFYKGAGLIKKIKEEQRAPFLSANISYEDGKLFTEPYILKTLTAKGPEKPPFKKLRVGIFGLCDARAKLTRKAVDENPVRSTDPAEAASKIVKELDSKSDIIILLFNGKYRELERVLKAANDKIDIVVLGGEYYSARPVAGSKAIIASSPSLGKYFNRLTIVLDKDKKVISTAKSSVPIEQTIKQDSRLVNIINDFDKAKKQAMKKAMQHSK